MSSTARLSDSHLRTFDTIFQHPVSRTLAWRDVHALFRHLGQVEIEPNGNLKVTRHGLVLILNPPRTKDVAEVDELMAVRHFLEKTEAPPVDAKGSVGHWLVALDHHEARIYRSTEAGSIPQQIRPARPPEEFVRHADHPKNPFRGQEKPEPNLHFEPVAGVLNGAGKILIFGHGTGTSSEMEQFVSWLKENRPLLAKRIVGTMVIDAQQLSEAQLLAKAREFFARAQPAST